MKVVLATEVDQVPLKSIDGKPTLVYWDIVGLAGPLRLTLALAGVTDCTDVRIVSRQAWITSKQVMMEDDSFAFPNLPYYIDETVTLMQSDAILSYMGRKYNLMGVPGQEHVVDMVINEVKDVEGKMTNMCYADDSATLASFIVSSMVPVSLKQFDAILEGKDFVTGDSVSIADVKLFSFLLKVVIIQSDLEIKEIESWLSDNANLSGFMKRMNEIPALKTFMESPSYIDRPINASMAKNPFGPK